MKMVDNVNDDINEKGLSADEVWPTSPYIEPT